MTKRIELVGNKYGRLTVVSIASPSPSNRVRYLCLCDCGAQKIIHASNLRDGKTKSCGCLNKEVLSSRVRVHGQTNTSEHAIWCGIRNRCNNESSPAFSSYGGRGIKICERWNSFQSFYADMGPRPSTLHSIERINNDGDYEPGNCRWATRSEQSRNRRSSQLYTFNGESKCLEDWAKEKRIKPATVYFRFHKGLRGNDLFVPPYTGPRASNK